MKVRASQWDVGACGESVGRASSGFLATDIQQSPALVQPFLAKEKLESNCLCAKAMIILFCFVASPDQNGGV